MMLRQVSGTETSHFTTAWLKFCAALEGGAELTFPQQGLCEVLRRSSGLKTEGHLYPT